MLIRIDALDSKYTHKQYKCQLPKYFKVFHLFPQEDSNVVDEVEETPNFSEGASEICFGYIMLSTLLFFIVIYEQVFEFFPRTLWLDCNFYF